MCQKCDNGLKTTKVESEAKQTFPNAGDAGVISGLGIDVDNGPMVFGFGLSLEPPVPQEEAAPGEVLIDSDLRVTHGSPDNLEEVIGMAAKLNGCNYFGTESHTQRLIIDAANLTGITAAIQRARSQDEQEDLLQDQKDVLAKIIATAIGSFALAMKGADYSHTPTTEEVAAELLSLLGDVIADEIIDKVEDVIARNLADMGLNPAV